MTQQLGHYDEYVKLFGDLEGWFRLESAALWDCLLTAQRSKKISGDLFEIGFWKGRSGAVMALHCVEAECCVFVDLLSFRKARNWITRTTPGSKHCFFQRDSKELSTDLQFLAERNPVRWFHIDGDHTASAVSLDLQLADHLLHPRGVLVVDDLFSYSYPQVTKAVHEYQSRNPSSFTMFLCGFNQGFFCRPSFAEEYQEYVKTALYFDLCERGHPDITIWKTASDQDMGCFGVTRRYGARKYRGPDWDDVLSLSEAESD